MSKEKQIEVVTYEQDRLYFFVDQVSLAQKKYDRLFKTFKDAPYLSEGAQFLSDAGRELQFYKDVVEMLDKGYRKQSEGEWHEDIIAFCNVCSSCRAMVDRSAIKCNSGKLHYCPNCGAKMKGGAE